MIGGGGVRTPLLIHAIAQARELQVGELALFDVDAARTGIIAEPGPRNCASTGEARWLSAPHRPWRMPRTPPISC